MRSHLVERHYHNNTRPAKDFGYYDEKRLQEHFGDRFLRLRWNPEAQKVFVWYDSPKDLYSLCDIPAPYDIWKAIKNLEQRQKRARQLQEECAKKLLEQEKAEKEQIKALADPIADSIIKKAKGRVTVTV